MSGYCGKCNTHYDGHYSEHDDECEGEEMIEQGSVEDFENQRKINNWDDEQAEEIYNENFKND